MSPPAMTYMAIFTAFQFLSPHLFNAKVFLVDVKEQDFEDADEGYDMARRACQKCKQKSL